MKNHHGIATLLVLAAGYLMIPAPTKATETGDSAQISRLLADAKAEAVELKHDSADLESFTKSKLHWETYGRKLEMIREHVNSTGKLLAQMKEAETTGSPWQQTAIKQIEPFLRELADNTTATIEHLNNNREKIHFQEFKDYVRVHYELSTELEALIRDFVNYGEAKEKAEHLSVKREIPD
jgi:hypothetical protein